IAAVSSTHDTDWGRWSRVLLICKGTQDREDVLDSLKRLGLQADLPAVIEDETLFDSQKYLAALLLMSAQDAAVYTERALRGRAGIACPWMVMSTAFTSTQKAALIASGAAGLFKSPVTLDALQEGLGSLIHRLEVPTQTVRTATPQVAGTKTRTLSILL